jgi:hypothetical protein
LNAKYTYPGRALSTFQLSFFTELLPVRPLLGPPKNSKRLKRLRRNVRAGRQSFSRRVEVHARGSDWIVPQLSCWPFMYKILIATKSIRFHAQLHHLTTQRIWTIQHWKLRVALSAARCAPDTRDQSRCRYTASWRLSYSSKPSHKVRARSRTPALFPLEFLIVMLLKMRNQH